jgi:alkylation response protein AidB-like acyl-CoA dehydrogenase
MKLELAEEYESLRLEVREFVASSWNPDPDEDAATGRARQVAFRKAAIERGYLGRGIPRKHGGSEQADDPFRGLVIEDEIGRAGAPLDPTPPVSQLIPTLLEYGTEEQRLRFLPGTLTGEIHWCQGYSEPNAGSDLASLRTRAELSGDEWVINGQKIWTSGAERAEYMYLLVRTEPDAPAHAGISYLLLDMKTPGITVRPLKDMTGDAHFSEVFLDDVRAPASMLVGKRGEGWLVSRSTLKHERGLGAISSGAGGRVEFEKLLQLARETLIGGRPAIEEPTVRQRLAEIDGHLVAFEASAWRQLTCAVRGEDPGPVAMMMKLVTTENSHLIARLTLDLLGPDVFCEPPSGQRGLTDTGMGQYYGSLGYSVAAGASNIQRNVIGERALGLPRDPKPAGPKPS